MFEIIKLTYFVCILQLQNLITRKCTWEHIKLVQGPLELARGSLIISKGPYVSGLAPIGAQRFCLLRVRLFIVQHGTSIDVNQCLLASWVVKTRHMYPSVFWDPLLRGSPVHCLVHVSLEKPDSAFVEDLKVVLALFSGICNTRGFRHKDLIYIRSCHVLGFDPCCYGNP